MMKYLIGARSEERAIHIANEHGLTIGQWRRAHGGQPAHLLDGLRVTDRKQLIGEFTEKERWMLTVHLPPENSDGKA